MRTRLLLFVPFAALLAACSGNNLTGASPTTGGGVSGVQFVVVDGSTLPPQFSAPSPNSCPSDAPRLVNLSAMGNRLDVNWSDNPSAEKTIVKLFKDENNVYSQIAQVNVDRAEGRKYVSFYPKGDFHGQYYAMVSFQVCGAETKAVKTNNQSIDKGV